MNTPNPLIPQGTFPDSRGRSHIRIAVFTILAVHVVLLGALLMAGCKKTTNDLDTVGLDKGATNPYPVLTPPVDTNPVPPLPTNPPVVVVAPSNPVVNPIISTPVTPDVVPAAGTEYVVVKGDSFYTLAKKYGVTTAAITEANPGVDSKRLKIGQKLKIPAASAAAPGATVHTAVHDTVTPNSGGSDKTYTVKSGDNLMNIAKANGVSLRSLRSANNLKTDRIKVGQKLKIPSKGPVAEPVSAPVTPTATAAAPTP